MGGVNSYSTTAASNTTLGGITLADSMAPTNLDNVQRAQMADIRKGLNDIGGKAVSSGTDTITLTTDSTVTSYFDGLRLTFIAGGTNTGAATLNVDSVGAKKVLKGGGTALGAGDITSGMAVDVVYDESADSASGAWMLLNPNAGASQPLDSELTALAGLTSAANKIPRFTGSGTADLIDFKDEDDMASDSATAVPSQQSVKAYVDAATSGGGGGVPVGTIVPYGGTAAPDGWLLCYGQNISRTTYSDLFTAIGTTYGVGDGTTTFALPDLRGRTVAGQDDMGGTSANRLTNQTGGLNGDTLGATGGAETHTLTTAQMPAHTHTQRFYKSGSPVTGVNWDSGGDSSSPGDGPLDTASAGGDGAHNNVQPTIILNYMIYAGV